MQILKKVLLIFIQFVLGYILGLGFSFLTSAGGGMEFFTFGLGHVLGVWVPGAMAGRITGEFAWQPYYIRLLGAVIGAALGVLLIIVTPAAGFIQILYPLLGALAGYYTAEARLNRI